MVVSLYSCLPHPFLNSQSPTFHKYAHPFSYPILAYTCLPTDMDQCQQAQHLHSCTHPYPHVCMLLFSSTPVIKLAVSLHQNPLLVLLNMNLEICGKSWSMIMFSDATGSAGAENIAAELKVAPTHSSLRVRLMNVFCRSIAAANAFPYTLQCIFGCIYGILPL